MGKFFAWIVLFFTPKPEICPSLPNGIPHMYGKWETIGYFKGNGALIQSAECTHCGKAIRKVVD